MTETTTASRSTAHPSKPAQPATVRLSVNLASDVAQSLKDLSSKQGLSATLGVRKAIILWKLLSEETDKGNRIMVVSGEGEDAKYREIVLL